MMGRPGRGPLMGRPGTVRPERGKDLRATLRRLLVQLRPERGRLVAALAFGVTSVGFMVTGPRILGTATNILFDGVVSKHLPAGMTKAQAIALLRPTARASWPACWPG